jgi:peptidyl-prolyl cis-trans isomerase SurA
MRAGRPRQVSTIPVAALGAALIAAACGALGTPVRAERQIVDRVVAQVDDQSILLSEVLQEMNLIRLQRDLGDLSEEDQQKLFRKVLDDMISDQLLVVQAKSKGYEVSDEELRQAVDEAVRDIKERLGGEERYRSELQKQGITEAEIRDLHKEQKRKQILAGRLVQSEIRRQISVSDDEVRTWYETRRDSLPPEIFESPAQVRIAHLLVVPRPDAEKVEAARAKIARAQARVAAGEDFATVAREMSEWPTAENGGSLGTFRYGDFESDAFDEAVSRLEPGQVSDVIETRFGLQIVKLETRQGDEMTARHIVVKLVTDEKAMVAALEKILELRRRILAGESFEKLAQSESDDPNTRDQGGLVAGDMPVAELLPDFRAAIDSVAVGEVTSVVRSTSGFHIFKLLARTESHQASFEDAKEPLRRWLEQRDMERRYRAYLDDLRKKFYVDIKV